MSSQGSEFEPHVGCGTLFKKKKVTLSESWSLLVKETLVSLRFN